MDTNWCSYCDKAVSPYSNSLYCSDECLQNDARQNHPILGFLSSERDRHPHQASIPPSEDESALSTSCCGAAPSLSSSFGSSSYLSVRSSMAVTAGPIASPLAASHHRFTAERKYLRHSFARPLLPTLATAVATPVWPPL